MIVFAGIPAAISPANSVPTAPAPTIATLRAARSFSCASSVADRNAETSPEAFERNPPRFAVLTGAALPGGYGSEDNQLRVLSPFG